MSLPAFLMAWAAAASAAGPLAASEPWAGQGRSASIFATIGHSEWCAPGNVRLNLDTGRYTVTAPRTWRSCRRPAFPRRVRTAVLAGDDLAAVRAAYRNAAVEGLEHPACRNGGRPERIVISNGGTTLLRLSSRDRTMSPPGNPSCWSDAAWRLHRLLEDLFDPGTRRRR